MKPSNSAGDDLKVLIDKVSASDVFARCVEELKGVSGVSPSLVPITCWPPARMDHCPNLFCEALPHRIGKCSACEHFLNSSLCHKLGGPSLIGCLGGIAQLSACVWSSETPVGYLVLEPLLIGSADPDVLERTISLYKAAGTSVDRCHMEAMHSSMPQLPAPILLPTINKLAICAAQVSEEAERLASVPFSSETRAVHQARKYLEQSYARKLSIEQIANAAGLSVSHFCRIFKRITSCTPIEYLNRLRVQRAQLLLISREFRINEIAYSVGFGSVPHFNRIFKQISGISPGRYRGQQTSFCAGCTAGTDG